MDTEENADTKGFHVLSFRFLLLFKNGTLISRMNSLSAPYAGAKGRIIASNGLDCQNKPEGRNQLFEGTIECFDCGGETGNRKAKKAR